MKKLLALVLITGALVACNNSGESTTSSDTTTMAPADSGQNMMMDTSNKMMDTTSKMSDTTHK